ncbi:MAG: thioredoxin family protein [Desulfosporosinus sp.]|nr:thioredoxin family protein [Desulfosporosinus sp.]
MAEKFPDVKFVKMLRQVNRPLAEKLGVKGSPTVLFFRNGEEVGQRLSGYISITQARQAFESVLGIKSEEIVKEKVSADVLILGEGLLA